jgi:AraC-like DNA-binding protein
MTDLEFIRQRIAGYADYADTDARHQVDKQIRAYLGEALSEARDRLQPTAALAERLDGLILRCEFSDQRVIKAADHAYFGQALVDRIHELDREIVECADRVRAAPTVEALATELDAAARYLDERFGALADAPSTP